MADAHDRVIQFVFAPALSAASVCRKSQARARSSVTSAAVALHLSQTILVDWLQEILSRLKQTDTLAESCVFCCGVSMFENTSLPLKLPGG